MLFYLNRYPHLIIFISLKIDLIVFQSFYLKRHNYLALLLINVDILIRPLTLFDFFPFLIYKFIILLKTVALVDLA